MSSSSRQDRYLATFAHEANHKMLAPVKGVT